MANSIQAVIFDLGMVILDFDHWRGVKRIALLTDKPAQQLYDFFFDSKLTGIFESGKVLPEVFFRRVKKNLRLRISYKEFLHCWNDIFFLSEENKKTCAIAQGLKEKYKLAILSNVNILHLNYIKKNFPVFDIFDHVFASCQMGAVKPQASIYTATLKALQVKSCESFYVDDRPELIKRARSLGMHAYVFSGAEQLKKDLASCGIIDF
ncbi:MAG: HAD family phosphatase [Candidatus Omnitrophota bacterium]|nr:HAD family phosphatase [Candidatus Omnitrophota bacterium]